MRFQEDAEQTCLAGNWREPQMGRRGPPWFGLDSRSRCVLIGGMAAARFPPSSTVRRGPAATRFVTLLANGWRGFRRMGANSAR